MPKKKSPKRCSFSEPSARLDIPEANLDPELIEMANTTSVGMLANKVPTDLQPRKKSS